VQRRLNESGRAFHESFPQYGANLSPTVGDPEVSVTRGDFGSAGALWSPTMRRGGRPPGIGPNEHRFLREKPCPNAFYKTSPRLRSFSAHVNQIKRWIISAEWAGAMEAGRTKFHPVFDCEALSMVNVILSPTFGLGLSTCLIGAKSA
jgi:hypothetical protein